MIVFTLPRDVGALSLSALLRLYAGQINPRDGGLRFIATLTEAADEIDLAAAERRRAETVG